MIQFHTLVASDLDGTLLPEGQTELPCAVFDEIRRLHDCGVLFCAASGRPLDALRRLFAPVADEIAYMSENAAYVCYGRELLHTIPMPREKDFSEVKGDVTQISAISAGDMNIPAKEILPLWQDRIGAAVTGEHWLDFTAAGKDKGLHLLCAHFGIPQENTYAFGDSYNDAPMLRAAAHPYLMRIAPADLKAEFATQIDDVTSVLKTLGH